MSATEASPDPFQRHKTPYRGIVYRIKADGSRSYYVYGRGRFTQVAGGEEEALARRVELRGNAVHPFAAVAEEWFASKRKLRRSTRERYRGSLDRWLLPQLGHLDIVQITPDRIASLIVNMEATGSSSASILNHLKPLSGTFKLAMRKGLISRNPVELLSSDERPRVGYRETRILEPAEIESLLAAAEQLAQRQHAYYDYTLLLRVAIFSGLRLGELLGLQWQDVDFEAGTLHVRRQVTPRGEVIEPKTLKARRRVVIAPKLARMLAHHQAVLLERGEGDPTMYVFASRTGGALSSRNVVNRGFRRAVELAKLDEVKRPRLRFHDLRHCYASMMVAQGLSSTDVSVQLGHANSSLTERIYIHQFNSYRTHQRLRKAAQQAMTGAMTPSRPR